jgi:hypothetical protein
MDGKEESVPQTKSVVPKTAIPKANESVEENILSQLKKKEAEKKAALKAVRFKFVHCFLFFIHLMYNNIRSFVTIYNRNKSDCLQGNLVKAYITTKNSE